MDRNDGGPAFPESYEGADAPDMYEAGKLILEILDHPTRSVTALDADKLRAALAKAEAE